VSQAQQLGERIKDLRYRRGLTQAQLAYKAGIGEKTLKRLESGKTDTPRPDTLAAVAGALGLESSELLFGPGDGGDSGEGDLRPALHQLPQPPRSFMGRGAEIQQLEAQLEAAGATVCAIHGMGGVGKTALALLVAQRWSERFPDAQIYMDLRATTDPVTAVDAMLHVIRSLEPGRATPKGAADVAASYHSVLRGKRALLLMDNALDRKQVEPLIPPEGSLLLLTSRQRFALAGLRAVALSPLQSADAQAFIDALAPHAGEVAGRLASLCGGLPLALSLAGRALAERPDLDPAEYAERLDGDRERIHHLDAAEASEGVEVSFEASYRMLEPEQKRGLCALGVFPQHFDRAAAAAVWGLTEDETDSRVGTLLRYNLLESDGSGRRARYRLHDLVRLFANSRSSDALRLQARVRHARHYVSLLHRADLASRGGDADRGLALADREWGNIQEACSFASARACRDLGPDEEPDRDAAQLICSALDVQLLRLRKHAEERIRWYDAALEAARRIGDRRSEGRLLGHAAVAHQELGDPRSALSTSLRGLDCSRQVDDRGNEAALLIWAADAHHALGQPRQTIELCEQALEIARALENRATEAGALVTMAWGYQVLGDPPGAAELARQALPIAIEVGDRALEGHAHVVLAHSGLVQGTVDSAQFHARQALGIARQLGDRRMQGYSLIVVDNSEQSFEEVLAIVAELGDRRLEGYSRLLRGLSQAMSSNSEAAIEQFEHVTAIADATGDQAMLGNALLPLGPLYMMQGKVTESIAALTRGVEATRGTGNRRFEAQMTWLLASAHEINGAPEASLEALRRAAGFRHELGTEMAEAIDAKIKQLEAQLE